MSFDNVTFPDYPLKHDVSRETIYPIKTLTNGTTEWRGTHVRFEKYRWTLPLQTMTPEQKEDIREFLVQRNHGLNSFRFQCPMTPTLSAAPLSYNSGSYWNFYLPFSSTTPGDMHPVYNPILNELSVTVDGNPGTISGITFIDNVPCLDILGTNGDEVVKVSGNLYFTVKLLTPLNYALSALNCNDVATLYNVQPLQLQEVFGEY